MRSEAIERAMGLVADAVGCDLNELPDDAALNATPLWDSLGQVAVIVRLEEAGLIEINPSTVSRFTSIAEIAHLYLDPGEK